MTQTTELSTTSKGFDGPHGTVFGLSNAEAFTVDINEPPVPLEPGTPEGEDDRR